MQTDYYVDMTAGPSSYPLLDWDELAFEFSRPGPMVVNRPLRLKLGAPVPRNPVMVDYHSLPKPVVSTRIKEVLEPLNLYGVQLVPADVKVTEGDVRRYWIIRVYNDIACVERKLSKYTLSEVGEAEVRGCISDVEKLVLDERVLREIPLERRLVFRLEETLTTHLFHQSVVERVLALKPEGLRFIRADEWSDSAGFRP